MFSFLKKVFHSTDDVEDHPAPPPVASQSVRASAAAEEKNHKDRGNTFLAEGKLDEAATCYAQAIKIDPADVEGYVNLAYVRGEQKRYAEAETHLKQAIAIDPKNIDAYFMLAGFARKQSNRVNAITYFEQTLCLQPDFDITYRSLLGLDRFDEAVSLCDELLRKDAQDVEAHVNRGHALKSAARYDEALQSFATAVAIQPSHIEANFNESLCRLMTGDLERGWPLYEWRWQNDQMSGSKRHFVQPLWLGKQSLEGKTILLHAEQGLGDTIQFCRYATMVAALGATVLLLVPPALGSMMSGLAGVRLVFTDGQELPWFDYYCPLLSLPLAFGTTLQTVPANVPYLFASADLVSQTNEALRNDGSFRVGLCWKGGGAYPADSDRSPGIAPFEKLTSRLRDRKVSFYTLLPDSRAIFSRIGGEDIGHELDAKTAPFAETSALIMNLDLVITCDTSIGHLAGALGKEVWLVLPFSSDWRWIRGRDDSVWYPRTQLIRQTVAGDWSDVFDRVSAKLSKLLDDARDNTRSRN